MGFLNLPDDDITLDDGEDNDDQMDHSSFHPCLDQYVKDCLNMNLSVKNKRLLSLPDTKLPDVNIQYLYFIDELCKLMESCDPAVFIEKCANLMASNHHNITLFSDKVLKEFGEFHNASVMLRYLMCYCTWCDLSMIQKLLEACGYPDGVKLLENFKNQIRPIAVYSIPSSHSLMIPSDASLYTVMATQYEFDCSPLSLKHITEIKLLITESCEITPISCQFLAINDDSQNFHWLIPKNVVPLIVSKVRENWNYLFKHGIKNISIYPNSESFFASDNRFSLFATLPANGDFQKVRYLAM